MDLCLADLRGANLARATLRDTFLYRADLRNADLSGADLSGARLEVVLRTSGKRRTVKLTSARYDARTRWPEGFDPVRHGAVFVQGE